MKTNRLLLATLAAALTASTGCAFGQCYGGACYSQGFQRAYYASAATFPTYWGGGYYVARQTAPCAVGACAPTETQPTCAPCGSVQTFQEPVANACACVGSTFQGSDETARACSPCACVGDTCKPTQVIAQEGDAVVCSCAPCTCGACACEESDALTSRGVHPLLAAVNAARVARGLAALTVDASLEAGARAHSESMRRYGALYHAHGMGCAENCARSASVQACVSAWTRSQGHAANMFSARYTRAGVGVAYDANGGAYYTLRLR